MTEETTDVEPKALSVSFADPYLLIIRDDFSLFLINCDKNGELEEVEMTEHVRGLQLTSGVLYRDQKGAFGASRRENDGDDSTLDIKLFLLTSEGGLHVSLAAVFKRHVLIQCPRCTVFGT